MVVGYLQQDRMHFEVLFFFISGKVIRLLLINDSEINGRNTEKRTLTAALLLSLRSYIFYRGRDEASWHGKPYSGMHPIKQLHKEANCIKIT